MTRMIDFLRGLLDGFLIQILRFSITVCSMHGINVEACGGTSQINSNVRENVLLKMFITNFAYEDM